MEIIIIVTVLAALGVVAFYQRQRFVKTPPLDTASEKPQPEEFKLPEVAVKAAPAEFPSAPQPTQAPEWQGFPKSPETVPAASNPTQQKKARKPRAPRAATVTAPAASAPAKKRAAKKSTAV